MCTCPSTALCPSLVPRLPPCSISPAVRGSLRTRPSLPYLSCLCKMRLQFTVVVVLLLVSFSRCNHYSDPCGNAATQAHYGDIAYLTLSNVAENVEREARAATSHQALLWPRGIVPYTISSSFTVGEARLIYEAMKNWEDHTCIRFKQRTNEVIYINYFPGSGCCSFVGRVARSQVQGVSLGRGCLWPPTILHEIGHVVGFWHEQSRPDRDDYVDILYDNIWPYYESNFYKLDESDVDSLGIGYDYNSIMHYRANAFSLSYSLRTIQAKDPNILLGNAYALSQLDILQANRLYNCDPENVPPPMIVVPPTPAPPTSSPPTNPFSCGGVLLDVLNGSFHSPGYPHTYMNNKDCAWYIRGPTGHRLVVTFQDVQLDYSVSCVEDYVQIIEGFDLSGIYNNKICGTYVITTVRLYSHTHEAIVRFHTDEDNTESGLKGFAATFQFVDINECNDDWRCAHNCSNFPGSYSCYCREGFFLSANGRTCFDVNECALEKGGCQHKCVNSAGSFNCECNSDYLLMPDGKSCQLPDGTCKFSNGGCDHVCSDRENETRVCSCREGYRLQADGQSCVDISECAEGTHNCQHYCTNIPGSFICSCRLGFIMNGDGRTCTNIDECALGFDTCDDICIDIEGSFDCDCSEGLVLAPNGWRCLDINECEEGIHNCSDFCNNRYAFYFCTCPQGYVLRGSFQCEDLDECFFGRHQCNVQSGAGCVNTIGSYYCTCPPGYQLDSTGFNCVDINECLRSNQGCEQLCINTAGSFECGCRVGYILESDGVSCNASCGQRMMANSGTLSSPNWPQTYPPLIACEWTITLPDANKIVHLAFNDSAFGLAGPPCLRDWVDIYDGPTDTATLLGHFCYINVPHYVLTSTNQATVVFVAGVSHGPDRVGFSITYQGVVEHCMDGFQRTEDGLTCEDIDECATGNGGCEVQCTNTNGSFACSCGTGYHLGDDGKSCDDSNECEDDNGGCEHQCVNTDGSFVCSCRFDHVLDPDGKSCSYCGANMTAVNGSFNSPYWPTRYPNDITCTWTIRISDPNMVINFAFDPSTYGVAGRSPCKDWVEIFDGDNTEAPSLGRFCYTTVPMPVISSTNEAMVVFMAGPSHSQSRKGFKIDYQALDIVEICGLGYRLERDGTCKDLDECAIGKAGCEGLCTNTIGSFECSCAIGYELGDDGKSCKDVNECLHEPNGGGCDQNCTNTEGSFFCACSSNFLLALDGRSCISHEICGLGYRLERDGTCKDLDECAIGTAGCEELCTNTIGSFECSCAIGYELGDDGKSCTDVNECLHEPNGGGCDQNCTNTDGSFFCACSSNFSLAADGRSCSSLASCGDVLVEDSGDFSSLHWPQTYPNGIYCEWTITLSNPNKVILFVFDDSEYGIAGTPPCESDWLEILNGGDSNAISLGRLCSDKVPKPVISSTNWARVVFQAGPSHASTYPGFRLTYQSVADPQGTFTCGRFLMKDQPFGPPEFPGLLTQQTGRKCSWRYYGSSRGARFRLFYFDIPESEGCSQDKLVVYDGLFASSPKIITLCGTLTEYTVESTGTVMLVELHSRTHNVYRGFHGVFEQLP